MPDYRNVSVRLSNDEFEQLQYLRERYAEISYGKVSNADVLRTAIKKLYKIESEIKEIEESK